MAERTNDPLAGLTRKQIWMDCIWLSDESATTKIVLLCIGRYFEPNGRSSSLSYSQIATDCNLHEKTAIRAAIAARDRWLRVDIGKGTLTPKGRQNLYHCATPPELVEKLREQKLASRREDAPDYAENDGGVVSDYPPHKDGVASDYPEDARGSPGFHSGSPQTTHSPNTPIVSRLVVDGVVFEISNSQSETFNRICNLWGKEPNIQVADPLDRKKTDSELLKLLEPYTDNGTEILRAAISNGLIALEAARDELAATRSFRTKTWRGALTWFSKALPNKINDARIAELAGQARALSEKHLQEQLHANRLAGLNGAGYGSARPSNEDIKRAAFGDRGNRH